MDRQTFESMGNRHKRFEAQEDNRVMPGLPVIVRLDGRSFHTFTKGLVRPFDTTFNLCMLETVRALVGEFHATIGYTQSDEISLAFINSNPDAAMIFDGRIQKLASTMASFASVKFNKAVAMYLKGKSHLDPTFDARVYAYPNENYAAESFLWRETDAIRNSVAMASQAHFPQKALQGVNQERLREMLKEKGVSWEDYPDCQKRGAYVRRIAVERMLTEEELSKIKPQYRPTGPVTRTAIQTVYPPLLERVTNRKDVLFYRIAPIMVQEDVTPQSSTVAQRAAA